MMGDWVVRSTGGEGCLQAVRRSQLSLFRLSNVQIFKYISVVLFRPVSLRELTEAYDWLEKYKASRKEAELHQVWGEEGVGEAGREGEDGGR